MPLNLEISKDIYYSESFKTIVRSCKEILIANATEIALTDKAFMYAHRNNFYVFLRGLGIDEPLIWPTAFINDITNPFDDFTHKTTLLLCNQQDLDNLTLQLNTVQQ